VGESDLKIVIFDCDGVLFDSQGANAAYYGHIAQALGRGPLTPEEEAYVHVGTVFESVARIFRHQPELIEEAHQIREQVDYTPFIGLMKPEPGIYDCLKDLAGRYSLAVLTNRSTTIGQVLETHRMAHFFQTVVSCLDVTKPKPDPEGAHKILAATGSLPRQAVYIGDAASDAETAQKAGIHFIAYKNPHLPAGALIDHFDQLNEALRGLKG